MGKSRVVPLKYISMPKLELVAAKLSMKIYCKTVNEDFTNVEEIALIPRPKKDVLE